MAKKAAKPAPAPVVDSEVEVVTKPGLGIDEGIVLTTFFLLVAAIVLVFLANKNQYPV
jgi:hypothetical protein